jgi:hypothetical protein
MLGHHPTVSWSLLSDRPRSTSSKKKKKKKKADQLVFVFGGNRKTTTMMRMHATDNGRSRAHLPGPMLVLLMLLASITTGNAFVPVAQPPRTSGRYPQIVSQQSLVLLAAQDDHGNDHHQHACEPILHVEARPVVPHALVERTASVATGTLLALSLFFAPVPTTSASANNLFFGTSAQPALAASKTVEQAPAVPASVVSTPETQVKSAKVVSVVTTPETQVKNAKAALAEATKRVKVADGKVKALDAALAKTEQSIIASEKAVQKTKEAVKQAEAKYRDMQNQKKVGPNVLDKESMKVGRSFVITLSTRSYYCELCEKQLSHVLDCLPPSQCQAW